MHCIMVAILLFLVQAKLNSANIIVDGVHKAALVGMDHPRKVQDEYVALLQDRRGRLSKPEAVKNRIRNIQHDMNEVISHKRHTASDPSTLFEVKKTLHMDHLVILHIKASIDAIHLLQKHPDIKIIQPNAIYSIDSASNNPGRCTRQPTGQMLWGLSRISTINKPHVYSSASYEYNENDGDDVTVYVIDSGVFVEHSDFEGRATWGYVSSSWKHEGEKDTNGHGTHVAGTIAGKTYGVAKKAKIVAVKVFGKDGSSGNVDIIEGLEWVWQNFVDLMSSNGKRPKVVTNMSLGGIFNYVDYIKEAVIAKCIDDGMTIVVAAGNDADDACFHTPARLSGAVTVGASDINDDIASFSNFGPCVDIFAPGTQILSAYVGGGPTGTSILQGTSMAAPHVTGVIARYLSQITDAPTPYYIIAWLLDTSNKNQIDLPILNKTAEASTPNRLLYMACTENGSSKEAIVEKQETILNVAITTLVFLFVMIVAGLVLFVCLTRTGSNARQKLSSCCDNTSSASAPRGGAYENEAYATTQHASSPPQPQGGGY